MKFLGLDGDFPPGDLFKKSNIKTELEAAGFCSIFWHTFLSKPRGTEYHLFLCDILEVNEASTATESVAGRKNLQEGH